MGKSLPEGYPSHPPPPPLRTAPGFGHSHTWRNANLSRQNAKSGRQNETPVWGGGEFRHFSNNSTMKSYFKMLLSQGGVCFFFSPACNVILCSSPFDVLCGGKWRLILWGRTYKRAPKLVASPQLTTLHSTGNISAEDSVYKNKVGHNNTSGIVSSLLFFPLKLLLHKVYIPNILCGLRLWIQDTYSKEKPYVSNVHINILMNISL